MIDIEDGDALEARFEELSRKVLVIIGDIIEALNTNVLGKRNGDGEIGRISQYYEELKNHERLMLEKSNALTFYLKRGPKEESPKVEDPKVEAPNEESSEEVKG
jgi:hypothetical protein